MKTFSTSGQNSDKEFFDLLFFNYLNLDEVKNNYDVVEKFTNDISDILNTRNGFSLFSIDIKKKSYLILIISYTEDTYSYNFGFIIEKTKAIDTGFNYKLEQTSTENLYEFITEISENSPLTINEIVTLMITKTTLSYKINKQKVYELKDLMDKYNDDIISNDTLTNLAKFTFNKELEIKNNIIKKFNNTAKKLKLSFVNPLEFIDINLNNPSTDSYRTDNILIISKIDKIFNIENKRYCMVTSYFKDPDSERIVKSVHSDKATNNSSDTMDLYHNANDFIMLNSINYVNVLFRGVPFNYLDEGRYIISFGDGSKFQFTTITSDPKVHTFDIEEVIDKSLNKILSENIKIDNLYFEGSDKTLRLSTYLPSHKYKHTFKDVLKGLKNLSNEYLYVIKKQKSTGDDVKITDDILYEHEKGKISYNDFAIQFNDESLKERLYTLANEYMVLYFRKQTNEDEIIEQLTRKIFNHLESVITYTKESRDIFIEFNNTVNIKIELYKNGSNFTYINEKRINKNEIINVLKEMSCYNSQASAQLFIDNITKKGLSVFIGLSSGYFIDKNYFKFKTTDKTNIYEMNIDGVDIKIKGKKVFNTLYNICILKTRDSSYRSSISNMEYINNHVFKSCETKFDYIKYKIMIDKSYQLYIDKSKEFLTKKVEDLDCNYVKYFDKQNKVEYDGIKVTGLSGKNYVIAYNLKESFVFMNPELDNIVAETDKEIYINGTYICMIDQSKMKSTVGYDTVVSKLLSLKNDSVIASSIYNLEDELNKG